MIDLLNDKNIVQGHNMEPVDSWDYRMPDTPTKTKMRDHKDILPWQIPHENPLTMRFLGAHGHMTRDKYDEETPRYHDFNLGTLAEFSQSVGAKSSENLRRRLANANDHFRRKASEVYNDQSALDLLTTFDRDVVVDISDFDTCSYGIPLSKLAAANFCEVGASVIFITDAGQRFIESLRMQGVI